MPFARNFYHSALSHCEYVVDFLLPHRCSVCMAELATAQALCPTCWKDLHFINSPICTRTGVPLPFDLGPQSVSLSAMRFPPAYDRARRLSQLSGVPMKVEWLRRVKKTSQQVGMTRDMRQKNLKGAFEVIPNKVAALEGKKVVLIDDVITTGSTVTACAKTLRKVGVARIDVLSVARVVMHESVAV